jgi:myo-inositol 2-dehydrogenase/D-chiro-inositol 1-dehydrogenase
MSMRIGVIGAGEMGMAHMDTIFGQTARACVTAVCDADYVRAESAAAKVRARHAVTGPHELIALDDVDAVIVGVSRRDPFRLCSALRATFVTCSV